MPRSYDTARIRFARQQARKQAKLDAHAEAVLERRQARSLSNLETLPTHLLRQCRSAVDHPSLLTAKVLRDRVRNSELPAAVRAEAAATLLRWAFPDDD